MGRFEVEDGRAATAEIHGRRLGDVVEKPKTLTISEFLKKARNSRKQYRLRGEDGAMLSRIAQAVDSIEGLSFADSKTLLLSEAARRIKNGDFRAGSLLGMSINSIKAATEVTELEEKKEFFDIARQRISEELDPK